MWHKDDVFHILAIGNWTESIKPCQACTYVLVCNSVVMDSWMANRKITAMRACPETKTTVHKNTYFLCMSFTFTNVAVTSCNINSKRIRHFNAFELLKSKCRTTPSIVIFQ